MLLSGWRSQLSRQLCFKSNAKQGERERERELTFVGKREDTQVSEFSHRLSLFLCWWKLLVAALREAALLENNFLLYSNLAEIIPLRN